MNSANEDLRDLISIFDHNILNTDKIMLMDPTKEEVIIHGLLQKYYNFDLLTTVNVLIKSTR